MSYGYPPPFAPQPPPPAAYTSFPPQPAPPQPDPEVERKQKEELEKEKAELRRQLDHFKKKQDEDYVEEAMKRHRERQKEIDDLVYRETETKQKTKEMALYWKDHPEAYEKFKKERREQHGEDVWQ